MQFGLQSGEKEGTSEFSSLCKSDVALLLANVFLLATPFYALGNSTNTGGVNRQTTVKN